MSNERKLRLIQVAKEFNVGINTITDFFTRNGLRPRSAFDSQALIQLRNAYCLQRKCLYCRIGHRLLSAAALRRQ